MKKKEYNESVIVSTIEKKSVTYPSIEAASKATGLSVKAISLRCNKRGSTPKDGIICEWADKTKQRAAQSKKSRNKGHGFELQILHELTDMGYEGLYTSRSESRRLDDAKIDLADTKNVLDFYVQCKCTAAQPKVATITKECPIRDKPLAIFWKQANSTETIKEFVTIPKDYFYKLIKKQ